MKNRLLFSSLFFVQFSSMIIGYDEHNPKTTYSYILKLQLPQQLSQAAGPWGSYKGNPFSLHEHWCVIAERQEIVACSVVITQHVKYKAIGNNVQYLYRQQDAPCKWYDLTLHVEFDPIKKRPHYSWHIEERSLDEVSIRIPENAFVILTDPEFIDSLKDFAEEAVNKKNVAQAKKTTIRLPDIVIKNNITKKEWQKAISYSNLAFPDLKAILNKAKEEIHTAESLVILQRHPHEIRIAGH